MSYPDLNLLVYLHLLIKHGSVTKVAQELNVSQPGVSAALRRLRAVLKDPVLVRTRGRMVPTPKALAVHAQVAGTLDLWERLGSGELGFDPARTTRSYSLLASDYIQFLLLPSLAAALAQRAPGAVLRVIPSNPYRRLQMVVEREVDLAIGYYHEAPEELRARRLFVEPMVCVMRRDHPAAAAFDLDAFTRHPHVGISSVSQGSYSATLESALAHRGIQRQVPLTVPSYLAVPQILLQTDYLALLPASVAATFSQLLPLTVHPSPIPLPTLDVSILYHNAHQEDAAHQWLRQLVVEVVAQLRIGPSTPA
ncbi:MAG TPA: LysR family transcriptional regulator [Ramlibacter sp.]|nr:LysR family transcriptional regulator [Ramlibacter sp.]